MTSVAAHIGPWLRQEGDHLFLDIWVAENASRTRVLGVYQGRLKIQLAAPAIASQANDALIRFLSEKLEISRAQIQLVGGQSSRKKRICLLGIVRQRALLRLSPAQGRDYATQS